MAISILGYGTAASTGWATHSVNVNTTGADCIILMSTAYNETMNVSDSRSNTWTHLTRYGSGLTARISYCLNPSVGTSHSLISTDGASGLGYVLLSGVNAFGSQNGSSTNVTGSVTPATDGSVIVTAYAPSASSGYTVSPTDFAVSIKNFVAGQCVGIGLGVFIQATAASISATWSSPVAPSAIACFSPSAVTSKASRGRIVNAGGMGPITRASFVNAGGH
jgi:hypothetical protein